MILATAGHVDHGKSTLLTALTGRNPTTTAQELERGMTIQLGHVCLADNVRTIGIIDVPGHQDFRRQTALGLAAAQGFIFVVAADDGWMPQSKDHFKMILGLGMRQGVVVITKCDLVDESRIAHVERDLRERFASADLDTQYFRWSKGDDTKPLQDALLNRTWSSFTPRGTEGRIRFDRQFQVRGAGTILAGTLWQGSLRLDDSITLQPSNQIVRIRGMQVYGNSVATATGPTRVALQVSDVTFNHHICAKMGEDPCGMKSRRYVVRMCGDKDITGDVDVICATQVANATLGKPYKDDNGYVARLKLEPGRDLRVGARGLIIRPGCQQTLTNFVVIDEDARQPLKTYKGTLFVKSLEDYLTSKINVQGFVATSLVTRHFEESISDNLKTSHDLVEVGSYITTQKQLRMLECDILSKMDGPKTCTRAEIFRSKGIVKPLVEKALQNLLEEKRLFSNADRISATPFGLSLPNTPFAKRIQQCMESGNIISLRETPASTKADKDYLAQQIADGNLLWVAAEHVMARAAFDTVARNIIDILRSHRSATIAEFRDKLGISRKPLQMILEYCDRTKLTSFDGARRHLTELQ